MCVVEIQTEDGLVGTGWCEDYARAYGMPTLHLATSDTAVGMVEYFPVPVWDDFEEAPHFDGTAVPEGGKVSLGDAPGLGASLSLAGFTPLV